MGVIDSQKKLARTALNGYFDGELNAEGTSEFGHHLESCIECQALLRSMESLRMRLQQTAQVCGNA